MSIFSSLFSSPSQEQEQERPSNSPGGSLSGLVGPLTGGGLGGLQGLLGNSGVGDLLRQGGIGQPLMADPGALSSGAEWLGNRVNDATSWAGNAWDTVSSGASDLWNSASETVGGWVNSATETAGNAWDSVSGWASSAWDSASNWAGEKLDGVRQFGSDLYNGVSQEGLGGIFDPVGMMDRQAAQRELADRFTIVGDDFQGERAPNAVSQAEYERICRMYSDIRLGRGDLTIDPSALGTDAERDAYRQGAMGDIANMLQTESGRGIISQLHDNHPQTDADGNPVHRHTTMVPLLDDAGNVDRTNGYAAPDGAGSMRTVNADGTLGAAGAGTDVHIRYNPGVNVGDAYPTLTGNNPWLGQMRSDVLLAHEMNHAIMQTSGMGDSRAVGAGDNALDPNDPNMAWDAQFRDRNGNPLRQIEHQAVGLGTYANDPLTENAYRAERRRMADMGAAGTVAGDATMVQRTSYVPRNAPAAAAPGTGTPAFPVMFPGAHSHDDHDHDD